MRVDTLPETSILVLKVRRFAGEIHLKLVYVHFKNASVKRHSRPDTLLRISYLLVAQIFCMDETREAIIQSHLYTDSTARAGIGIKVAPHLQKS